MNFLHEMNEARIIEQHYDYPAYLDLSGMMLVQE